MSAAMPSTTSPAGADSRSSGAGGFDPRSGSLIERALFNHRALVLLLCALVTGLLGWQATRLQLHASFEKTIPASHPWIRHFLQHQGDLSGLGNAVRIAVARTPNDPSAPAGQDAATIYDAKYLDTLRRLSDEVFLLPGVDRVRMKSLWTPSTRWVGVTEEGLEGGPVIPDGYDGSPASLQQLAANIARSGELGQLVARDSRQQRDLRAAAGPGRPGPGAGLRAAVAAAGAAAQPVRGAGGEPAHHRLSPRSSAT
jgi:hypothetical protein